MKIINTGNVYSIYADDVQTFDKLPEKVYKVRFSKMQGFFLESVNDLEVNEEKIYGIHMSKILKVKKSFEMFERNLGVILSGNKGIGKSLFAKLLGIKMMDSGYPIILVDSYIQGIASFLESINQEVVIMFDEFDKTFGEVKTGEGQASPQSTLLTLFDGMANGKKLFIITCNELDKLNSFLVNRPGRFHYHFRFKYPNRDEIREYLTDNLKSEFYDVIDSVIAFAQKVDINYDCLRALAFEINNGESFQDALNDLNIINVKNDKYNLTLVLSDGSVQTSQNVPIDMFNKSERVSRYFLDADSNDYLTAEFYVANCYFDVQKGINCVAGKDIHIKIDDIEDWDKEKDKQYKNYLRTLIPQYLLIEKSLPRNMRYAI